MIPRPAYSEKTLVEFMSRNNYKYLVVFDGSSSVETLKPLFSSKGLSELNPEFKELNYYNTSDSKIHFYKLHNLTRGTMLSDD